MNKKILIGSGVAAFIIGAVVGLYYYTKKSIREIANGLDNWFENEDDMNNYLEQENQQKKEEEKQKETIKVHNFKFDDCYKHIKQISIQEEIEKAIKEKCEECPCKKNDTEKMYNSTLQYLFDDKFYKDYINTVNTFCGDDGK